MSLKAIRVHRDGIVDGEFNWQTKVDGRIHDIPVITSWHADATRDTAQQYHVYGGLGCEQLGTRRMIRRISEQGLVGAAGVVIDFRHLPPSEANIMRAIKEVPVAAAVAFNEASNNSTDSHVNVLGHSQGGGVVLLNVTEAPELFGAVAAIAPVGINRASFGHRPSEKLKTFSKRYFQNAFLKIDQNVLIHPSNIPSVYEGGKMIIGDALHGRAHRKINFALDIDLIPGVQRIAEGHSVRIFAGENDPIFRLSELCASLGECGLAHLIEVVPGSHTFPTSSTQAAQLKPAVNWLKTVS